MTFVVRGYKLWIKLQKVMYCKKMEVWILSIKAKSSKEQTFPEKPEAIFRWKLLLISRQKSWIEKLCRTYREKTTCLDFCQPVNRISLFCP
jgi:hypothetical protein